MIKQSARKKRKDAFYELLLAALVLELVDE